MLDQGNRVSSRLVTTLSIGPYPVEVFISDTRIQEDDPDGYFDDNVRPYAITIHDRCKGSERWAVLFHELTHLALHLFGVELNSKTEEIVANAIGLTFFEALENDLCSAPGEPEL